MSSSSPDSQTPRPRGRRSLDIEIATLKSRIPTFINTFLLQISPVPANYLWAAPASVIAQVSKRQISVSLFFEVALRTFIHERPWDTTPGFRFIIPQVHTATDKWSASSWMQINIRVPKDLADQIFVSHDDPVIRRSREPVGGLCRDLNVSMATFVWSAARWFIRRLGEHRDLIKSPTAPPA